MIIPAYTLGVLGLCAVLVIFSYLDRLYRELGRVSAGRSHEHLNIFEAEIEPSIRLGRRHASLGFSILAQLSLILVAVETARGVFAAVPRTTEAVAELIVYLVVE